MQAHNTTALGLHIRFQETLTTLMKYIHELDVSVLQFFATHGKSGSYIHFSKDEQKLFCQLQAQKLNQTFIHSSYWINAASGKQQIIAVAKHLLKKEISIASMLEIPFLVLHPGTATWHKKTKDDPLGKKRGIETLVRTLNEILRNEKNVKILLENTAHGNRAIGSNLDDFIMLRNLLDYPEKVGFCLDFAHTFAYGYDLTDIEKFTALIDQTMGLSNIKLIHFNDSAEKMGSKKDVHALPGEGLIGKETLQRLLVSQSFKNIAKIIEPPKVSPTRMKDAVNAVLQWQGN